MDTAQKFVRQTLSSTFSYCLGGIGAFASLVVTESSAPHWIAFALTVIVLGFHTVELWRKHSGLGHRAIVRMLVSAAVALAFLTPYGGAPQWAVAIAFAGITLPGALESILRKAVAKRTEFVANLPGVEAAPRAMKIDRPVVTASVAAITIGAIVAVLGLTPWIWLVAAVLLDALYVVIAALAITRVNKDNLLKANLVAAVEELAPEFIIYNALPDAVTHQVMMWLPYLERTGRPFMIVTRAQAPARALAELTDAPIVSRRSVADLEAVLVGSLHAAFYVNASSGNGTMVRYPDLHHVFLGHGDSDKPTSYNPLHTMYDKVFAAGPAATRRYGAHGVIIPDDKFEVVGRPQLEVVEQAVTPIASVSSPTVFYAPTWRGHVEETLLYSLPVAPKIIRALLARGATVIFRPHPFSYQFPDDVDTIAEIVTLLEEDAARTGRDHLFGPAAEVDHDVFELTNMSDAMISDVSSVVSDYLYSGKPFAMVAVSVLASEFADEYPIGRGAYILEKDLSNLGETLDSLLVSDPLRQARLRLRADYLGDFPPENYAEAFIAAASAMIAAPRQRDEVDWDASESEELDRSANGTEPAESTDEATEDESDRSMGAVISSMWKKFAGRTLLPSGLAVAAMGLLLLHAPIVAVTWVGLAGSLSHLYLNRRVLRRRSLRNNMLRAVNGARTLLASAFVLVWIAEYGWSWTIIVAGGVIVVTTVLETGLRKAWKVTGLESRNLPGVETRGFQPLERGMVALFSSSVTAVCWLCVFVGTAPVIPLIFAALPLVFGLAMYVSGLVRGARSARLDEQLPTLLEEYGAEFAVYFGSTMGIRYQLGMWEEYFQRLGRRFIVVTRDLPMMRTAGQVTDAPVINRPTLRSLETVITPSLKLAFYVNNAGKNTHFIERRELTHVWLNHGDSEKPACFNPVHAIYDFIFSAGQAGIDRYARHGVEIPRQKFKIVGRPQVEKIDRPDVPIGRLENKTVLYAPTWKGPYKDTEVYSLPSGARIVSELLARGCTVVFRSHSFNYRFDESRKMIREIGALLDEDAARTGRAHKWGAEAEQEMSLIDCFNESDAMIADVSAVVSDYLQSGKPLAMVSVGRTPGQLAEDAPASQASYVIDEDMANLGEALGSLLGADPLAAEREQMRVYYLGDFDPEHYADVFSQQAIAMIEADRELV